MDKGLTAAIGNCRLLSVMTTRPYSKTQYREQTVLCLGTPTDLYKCSLFARETKSVKDDVIVCPKACLLFCYTLKCMYFFFTKRVHTFVA